MEMGNSLMQDLNFLLSSYNIFDENTGTISISNKIETMGNISWISKNIPSLFNYSRDEMKSMNISKLMPNLFAEYHGDILNNFYGTCHEEAINNLKHLWAINK